MSRRTRAVSAARKLIEQYTAHKSAHKITYSVDVTTATIHGPDDIFVTRMSVDWIPLSERETEKGQEQQDA